MEVGKRAVFISISTIPFLLLFWPFIASFFINNYDAYFYQNRNTFDSSEWKKGPSKYRFTVLDHIVSQKLHKAMSKPEVVTMLGEPDNIKDNTWYYESVRPGYRFIDFSGGGIELVFTNEKLTKFSNNSWVD